ncbi:MAG TPA: hypothetical protein VEA58_14055 [Anaerovoracaceae bacterium]|nr:hypothetical protein [Anaerovoracaceae bacterium]
MKKSAFKAALKKISKDGFISNELALLLPSEEKHEICEHIMKNRGPVLISLIPDSEQFDSHMNCMGYLYSFINPMGFKFRGTSAHVVANESRMKARQAK